MSNGEYDGEMKYDKLKTEENGNGNESYHSEQYQNNNLSNNEKEEKNEQLETKKQLDLNDKSHQGNNKQNGNIKEEDNELNNDNINSLKEARFDQQNKCREKEEEKNIKERKNEVDSQEEKKRRNEVVEDYINNLSNNEKKKSDEEGEDDEFDKAEAQYKRKSSNQPQEKNPCLHNSPNDQYNVTEKSEYVGNKDNTVVNQPFNQNENIINYDSKPKQKYRYEEFYNNYDNVNENGEKKHEMQYTKTYSNHNKLDTQSSLQKKTTLIIFPDQRSPGYLYEQENKSIQRQKTLRKKNMPSIKNSYAHTETDHIKVQSEDKQNNPDLNYNQTEQYIRLKPPHSQRYQNRAKENQKIKQSNAISSLTNPNNPFSNLWYNHILNVRNGSYLKVTNFLNGVPQFKIARLKLKQSPEDVII